MERSQGGDEAEWKVRDMPDSLEFVVGELSSSVRTLTGEVKLLRQDVGEIKLFRAKVLGACLVISAFVSFAIGVADRLWAR